jgi:hypothetical protein
MVGGDYAYAKFRVICGSTGMPGPVVVDHCVVVKALVGGMALSRQYPPRADEQ